ncbi:electron transfer flavoprotein subunit alpha/FixB family protein [Lacrimispora sp. AGF001]|uniref:electron transfer flavoprotein subunit alpha/FixB family protein n=1 Tax=Lacrimispora sp. AGF001 TaxID=3401631 RepID=UPI003B43BFB6|nr:electron transfer flavoprotein subunit alpha/FixB family protein [Paenibacillaceae bacterium]
MSKEITVICDSQEYDREDILQLVTKARSLGDASKRKVSVFCVGHMDEERISALFLYGADRVVFCREEGRFDLPYFTEVIAAMVTQIYPEVILVPATVDGKILAAVLSTRFEAGLTADCIEIEFDEAGELGFSRAAINDSVTATIKCINCNIMMGTVKKDVFIKAEAGPPREESIVEFTFSGKEPKCNAAWVVEERTKRERKKEIDIHLFKKVFCIGRGVKDRTVLERIYKIAEKYDMGIVGTRAVVEEKLIEKERQVGQSGKSISPQIYISFGVSGASQHMVGIKNAAAIIAVNTDRQAAIFDYADYSVVENLESILDHLEKLGQENEQITGESNTKVTFSERNRTI